jgi:hypothetical protein
VRRLGEERRREERDEGAALIPPTRAPSNCKVRRSDVEEDAEMRETFVGSARRDVSVAS